MRLCVDKAFVAVCTLCFLEPIFGMEVLSLWGGLVYVLLFHMDYVPWPYT